MKCKNCSKNFKQNSNSQKFCDDCKTKKCKVCGKSFKIANLGGGKYKGLYCSMDCYHRDRWGVFSKCKCCGEKTNGKKFCSSECQRDFWNKNDYRLIKKKRIWERKVAIIQELGGKCKKCSISDIRVLEINHIDRERKERPHKRQYNWTRRLKEWKKNIDNLELLCANCHRRHTWEQMGWGVGLDENYYEIAKKRIYQSK